MNLIKVNMLGIDPGLTGAISEYRDSTLDCVHDLPVCAQLSGKGNEINKFELAGLIKRITQNADFLCCIEHVSSMPQQGLASTFKFGRGFGVIEGILAANQIPIKYVRPAIWKRKFGLTKKDKDAARTMAINLNPTLSDQLILKKHIGRADAILIGSYGVTEAMSGNFT